MAKEQKDLGQFSILCLVPPPPPGLSSVQTDAVMARCAGIYTKADYLVPPLGLAYIAGYLREKGFPVSILDCPAEKLSSEGALRKLAEQSPRVVITAIGTSTISSDLAFLRRAKEESRGKLITVACGTHVTIIPQEALGEVGVDYVVRGEPEVTAGELCQALVRGNKAERIAGISFKKDGKVFSTANRPLLKDIDQLPPPARDLLPRGAYSPPFAGAGNFTTLLSSRGCPYPCIYCSTSAYFGKSIRRHSLERVMQELKEIGRNYDSYGFWDDTFTLNKSFVKAVCRRLIEQDLKKPWICMSRVDTVDAEMLSVMKLAGCQLIVYGVESGSEKVLSILNKRITVSQIERAFRLTRRADMESAGFFMLGTPGESYEDIIATMGLAQRLSPDYASFNITTPYPGTPLYQMLGERASEWVQSDARHAPGGKAQVLEELLRRAYCSFYFRPDYIARRFFRISRPKELLLIARAGASVLRRYLVGDRHAGGG